MSLLWMGVPFRVFVTFRAGDRGRSRHGHRHGSQPHDPDGPHPGVAQSIAAKQREAQAAAAWGNANAKAGAMRAYINEVQAQSGKSLTPAQAAILIQLLWRCKLAGGLPRGSPWSNLSTA